MPSGTQKLPWLVAAFGLACAGCDTIYGVSHSTTDFTPIPPDSCIVAALQSIPGMSDVSSRLEEGGRPLTLHGIEKPEQIHRFFYVYSGVRGSLFYSVSFEGHAEFYHSYISINSRPPQDRVDRIYPAFKAVDEALETRCGMADLTLKIRETCNGVHCGSK